MELVQKLEEVHKQWTSSDPFEPLMVKESKFYRFSRATHQLMKSIDVDESDHMTSQLRTKAYKFLEEWNGSEDQERRLKHVIEVRKWQKIGEDGCFAKKKIPQHTFLGVYGDRMWSTEEDCRLKYENVQLARDIDTYSFDLVNKEGGLIVKLSANPSKILAKMNCARGPDDRYFAHPAVETVCTWFGVPILQKNDDVIDGLKRAWRGTTKQEKQSIVHVCCMKHENFVDIKSPNVRENFISELLDYVEDSDDTSPPNVDVFWLVYQNKPVCVYVTTCDIKPGEQLFIDYGKDYWSSKSFQSDVLFPGIETIKARQMEWFKDFLRTEVRTTLTEQQLLTSFQQKLNTLVNNVKPSEDEAPSAPADIDDSNPSESSEEEEEKEEDEESSPEEVPRKRRRPQDDYTVGSISKRLRRGILRKNGKLWLCPCCRTISRHACDSFVSRKKNENHSMLEVLWHRKNGKILLGPDDSVPTSTYRVWCADCTNVTFVKDKIPQESEITCPVCGELQEVSKEEFSLSTPNFFAREENVYCLNSNLIDLTQD